MPSLSTAAVVRRIQHSPGAQPGTRQYLLEQSGWQAGEPRTSAGIAGLPDGTPALDPLPGRE
jgi:hypothetical protein